MSECLECECQHIPAWVSAGGRSGLGVKSHKNASLVTQKNQNISGTKTFVFHQENKNVSRCFDCKKQQIPKI